MSVIVYHHLKTLPREEQKSPRKEGLINDVINTKNVQSSATMTNSNCNNSNNNNGNNNNSNSNSNSNSNNTSSGNNNNGNSNGNSNGSTTNLNNTKESVLISVNGVNSLKNGINLANNNGKCLTHPPIPWNPKLDVWWHDVMINADDQCDPVWVDAEDPLFILYTR